MVTFESITHEYDPGLGRPMIQVLKDINFSFKEECITGFLGVNGAGKTTCIKILLQLIRPTLGSVYYSPKLVQTGKEFSIINSKIGYMPERAYYYPSLTGEEFVYYMGEISSLKRKMIKERMNYWRERAGLIQKECCSV
jgi:ABC-2 type transport system ATP-binding protein